MKIMKEYTGVLGYKRFSKAKVDLLEQLATEHLVENAISIGPHILTVSFVGYDHNDSIVNFLSSAAPIISNAEGEVECSIAEDDRQHTRDRQFTFYSVKDGHLFRQRGWVCRADEISKVEADEFNGE